MHFLSGKNQAVKVSAHVVKLADKEIKQKETHAMKLANKESKRQEKENQQQLIDNPSSATKPRSTKASATIIQELRHIATFQAQLFIFTKVDNTKELPRCALIEDYFHGIKKKCIEGVCIQLVNGKGPFCALYNLVEDEHTVELVLKLSCCGKETSSSYVVGVHFTVKDTATFGLNNKKMNRCALWDMGLNVLQSMKKALSLVPKLLPRIIIIEKNCAVTGYASGKNETTFLQYIDNGMFLLTKKDVDMLVVDESDDNDEVLVAKTKEGMPIMRDDVLIAGGGTPKTKESLIFGTDFEDVVVDNPVGLDSWNPFKLIAAPEGYSYIGKLFFICFGPSSKFFASTLAMGGKANCNLEEKKERTKKMQRKITKERANIDREVGIDRGMTMQARMQCAFMAQNEDDANQRHRDMGMVMLKKQI